MDHDAVLRDYVDLLNTYELFSKDPERAGGVIHRLKLHMVEAGWAAESISQLEREAVVRCNWSSDKYIQERLESKGTLPHKISHIRGEHRSLVRMKAPKITDPVKNKRYCVTCGLPVGRKRPWAKWGFIGILVCVHCLKWLETRRQEDEHQT